MNSIHCPNSSQILIIQKYLNVDGLLEQSNGAGVWGRVCTNKCKGSICTPRFKCLPGYLLICIEFINDKTVLHVT